MIKRPNKLVRDNIPQQIKDSGEIPTIRQLDETGFSQEAKRKLVEESNEVLNTKSREELLEELADVLEVVDAIADTEKITKEEIEEVRAQKNKDKGTFKKRIFLESIQHKAK